MPSKLRKPFHHEKYGANKSKQFIQRGNYWATIIGLSDYEKYVNGHCQFFFKYVERTMDEASNMPLPDVNMVSVPSDVPVIFPKYAINDAAREIWNLPFDDVTGDSFVISHWGQISVTIRRSGLLQHIQKSVPSGLTVGFQFHNLVEKILTYEVCESVLYGFTQPCSLLARGELNILASRLVGSEWMHNLPVPVVESGTDVRENIARRDANGIYNGFVLFGEKGSLAGLCICFEDIGKGALFAQNFIYLGDVFRRVF